MTPPKGSATSGESPRGRGLDALFESRPGPAAASQEIGADLAALLDNEVQAARGAGPAPTASRAPANAAAIPPPRSYQEPIDMPPAAGEAQPVEPAPAPGASSPPPGVTPAVSTPTAARPLPATKRFGAIIMDAAPTEPAATGLTPEEPTLEVGPAGELITGSPPTGSVEVAPVGAVPGRQPETKSLTPYGPGAEPEDRPLPAVPDRTDDQKTIIIKRLDQSLDKGWQRALHQQIDDLYKQVATEFSSPPENAEKALGMLREARQTLLETPEEYVTAEFRTIQVRAMLARTRESRKQSTHLGPRLLGYEVAWMAALLLGIMFAGPLVSWIGRMGSVTGASADNLFPFVNTLLWGGIGGVVGALYHLWWHISARQDFDRQYLMWYLVQPIMGLVLGGIVFLLMAGGFLVLQVNLTDPNASTAARLVPYLAAVLGGFRQNFVYEQFDRVIALFTSGSQEKKEG